MRNDFKKELNKSKIKKESHLITVRLPPNVFIQLEEAAKKSNKSRSEVIIRALKYALDIKD